MIIPRVRSRTYGLLVDVGLDPSPPRVVAPGGLNVRGGIGPGGLTVRGSIAPGGLTVRVRIAPARSIKPVSGRISHWIGRITPGGGHTTRGIG